MLLGNDEPQVLKLFKKTLPTRLYWVAFPCRRPKASSRDSQENSDKRNDRQKLTGQLSSTPFMSMKDGYVNKKMTFNTKINLEKRLIYLQL